MRLQQQRQRMKLILRGIRVDESAFNGDWLDWLSQVGVTVLVARGTGHAVYFRE